MCAGDGLVAVVHARPSSPLHCCLGTKSVGSAGLHTLPYGQIQRRLQQRRMAPGHRARLAQQTWSCVRSVYL